VFPHACGAGSADRGEQRISAKTGNSAEGDCDIRSIEERVEQDWCEEAAGSITQNAECHAEEKEHRESSDAAFRREYRPVHEREDRRSARGSRNAAQSGSANGALEKCAVSNLFSHGHEHHDVCKRQGGEEQFASIAENGQCFVRNFRNRWVSERSHGKADHDCNSSDDGCNE
jgi:hypothetical protein